MEKHEDIEKMIDLHSHSSASDGARSPADSARYAIEKKLRVWALTDHDTVDGLAGAASVCAEEGGDIVFVPGIELNIAWPTGEFHLLGLGLRRCSDELRSTIEYLSQDRRERNERMADMIEKSLGVKFDVEKMEEKFGTKQIGRPHFARMMAESGIVKRPQEAFDRFLGSGRPFYVGHAGEDLDTAVSAIKSSGGIPVMAHPKSIYVSLNKIEPIIEDVHRRGVLGLEAYHPCVRINEGARLEEIARKFGMFVTAGSDFHGKGVRADRHLGFTAGDLVIKDRFWDEELLPALGGSFDYKSTEFFAG